jgi:hypothetical protein
MSDENIVDFGKALNTKNSNNAETIEDRVINCMQNKGECECMYCNYRKSAATMVVEFLAKDISNFENNSGAKVCTYDLKDVLFKAIYEVKKWEQEGENSDKEE